MQWWAALMRNVDPDGDMLTPETTLDDLPPVMKAHIQALETVPRDVLDAYLAEPTDTCHEDTLWHAVSAAPAAAAALRFLQLSWTGGFASGCTACVADASMDDTIATAVRAVVTPKPALAWLLPRVRGRCVRSVVSRALYDPALVLSGVEAAAWFPDLLCVDVVPRTLSHPRIRPPRRPHQHWLTVPLTRGFIQRVCDDCDAAPVLWGSATWRDFMNGGVPRPEPTHPLLASLSAELPDDADFRRAARRVVLHLPQFVEHVEPDLLGLGGVCDAAQPSQLSALFARLARGVYPSELGAALSLLQHAHQHDAAVAVYQSVWDGQLETAHALVEWLHGRLPPSLAALLLRAVAVRGTMELWRALAPRGSLPPGVLLFLLVGAGGRANTWQMHVAASHPTLYLDTLRLLRLQAPRPEFVSLSQDGLEYTRDRHHKAVLVPSSPRALRLPPELFVQLLRHGVADVAAHVLTCSPWTAFGSARITPFGYPPPLLDALVAATHDPRMLAVSAVSRMCPQLAAAARRALPPEQYHAAFCDALAAVFNQRTRCDGKPRLWPQLLNTRVAAAAAAMLPRDMGADELLRRSWPCLPTRSMEWQLHAVWVAVAVRGVHGGMDPLSEDAVRELQQTTRFYAVWRFTGGPVVGGSGWVETEQDIQDVDGTHASLQLRCRGRVRVAE